MRRKHGGRESWGGWGGGDAESEWEERDAAISTAERKWGCQDKDRLRGRRRLEADSDISKNDKERRESNKKTKKKSDRKGERQAEEREKEREAKEVSSGCQAGGSASRRNHGSGTGRYGNQQSLGKKKKKKKHSSVIEAKLTLSFLFFFSRKETQEEIM